MHVWWNGCRYVPFGAIDPMFQKEMEFVGMKIANEAEVEHKYVIV